MRLEGGSPGVRDSPRTPPSEVGGWADVESGRVRVVRLVRRRGESFGFHLRGGREHGTGFFISHVEPHSEAQLQGLRAGDQVLRVNQLSVEGAVHREVAAMVQASNTVTIQVKGAGIIPCKESRHVSKKTPISSISSGQYRRRGDPLTWLLVEEEATAENHGGYYDPSTRSLHGGTSLAESELEYIPNPHQGHHEDGQIHVSHQVSSDQTNRSSQMVPEKVIINVGRGGLGCSICKGPSEKPGIYVQSIKSGGVAREAGLRAGDLILCCNNTLFTHLQFPEAVYVLKSSTRLVLDVVHGAGLELVAGESSGYNSSASSIAGDQTPPTTNAGDTKDIQETVTNRLSAVSKHLLLDPSRGWREIEAEWANAEAEEKRKQLNQNQKMLKTQKQRDALHNASLSNGSLSSSVSLSNLLSPRNSSGLDEARTVFRDGPVTTNFMQNFRTHKPLLRSSRSTNDVRIQGLNNGNNHKIALVTSHDPHVNNIVISGSPKDEKDALSRLDQLSSTSASSRLDSISSVGSVYSMENAMNGASSVSRLEHLTKLAKKPVLQKTTMSEVCNDTIEGPQIVEEQFRHLRLEQLRLREEAATLKEERRRFEEEKRGILRSHSVPLAPQGSLVIQCSGVPINSPPSPTNSTNSIRHTSKIQIKSCPPAPPPRDTSTTLSSRSNRHRGLHVPSGHLNYCHHQLGGHSPPSSPSASIGSSSGVASSCSSSGGAPPRRCKSIGSISASSGESTIWEDLSPVDLSTICPPHHQLRRSNLSVSTTLLPLSIYEENNSIRDHQTLHRHVDPIRQLIPPPPTLPKPPKPRDPLSTAYSTGKPSPHIPSGIPPPPPPPPPAPSSRDPPNLANALSVELERRTFKEVRGNLNEDARAQAIQDKIDNYKKEKKPQDPLKAQHDQLMDEFKRAHRKMFSGREDESPTANIMDDSHSLMNNVSPISSNKSLARQNAVQSHKISHGVNIPSKIVSNTMTSPEFRESSVNNHMGHSYTSTSQQPQCEHFGALQGLKPSKISKASILSSQPHLDFVPMSINKSNKPPETYFANSPKCSPNKPLVSIESYPSPSQRPQPKKMDFLHSGSTSYNSRGDVIVTDPPSREYLQNELCNTLKRSNLRQRFAPKDFPINRPETSFHNGHESSDSSSGPPSLSEKYQGLTTADNKSPTVCITVKGKEDLNCSFEDVHPMGILKPVNGQPLGTASRPQFHKSISFGDV